MAEQNSEPGFMSMLFSPVKSWVAEKTGGLLFGDSLTQKSGAGGGGLADMFNLGGGDGSSLSGQDNEEGGLWGGIKSFFSGGFGKMLMFGLALIAGFKMLSSMFGGNDEEKQQQQAAAQQPAAAAAPAAPTVKAEEPGMLEKGMSGLGAGLTATFMTAASKGGAKVARVFGFDGIADGLEKYSGGFGENFATAAGVGYTNNSAIGAGVGTVVVKGLLGQILSGVFGKDPNNTLLDEGATLLGNVVLNKMLGNNKAPAPA